MQYSSPKEYLKNLKIQRSYLKKFYYYYCFEWLRFEIKKCLDSIDKEIENYENLISEYILKKKIKENNSQVSIYEMLGD